MDVGPRDFFISYTGTDKDWAVWVAVELERAGYTTVSQALDILPGSDFVHEMQEASATARRTIAIVSPEYFQSKFGESEWRVAFRNDPSGERRLLIPVRVQPGSAHGLLSTRVYIDLVGLDEPTARRRLLEGVAQGPPRPTSAPFPGANAELPAASSQQTTAPFPGNNRQSSALSRDGSEATVAVLDAAGAICGTGFLVGDDVAVTSTDALNRAGRGGALQVAGQSRRIALLQIDRDDGLGVALVKLDRATGQTPLAFSYEDVNIARREVVILGYTKGEQAKHSDAVIRTVKRRSNDQTVTLLELAGQPARNMSGGPLIDRDIASVFGVLRLSDHESAPLAVPFSEISRRWPLLANFTPGISTTYDAIVATHLPTALLRSKWDRFAPDRLHCLVVTSESALDHDQGDGLDGLMEDLLASYTFMETEGSNQDGKRAGVWPSFCRAMSRQTLLDGGRRSIPSRYAPSSVELATFSVLDAFDSAKSLELASRLIIEADLALFDVTKFEPGVMLLLGLRAATRRGVTIVSYGDGWRAGDPLPRPFNLSDLSLASHTPPIEHSGEDARIGRMAERITAGFDQLALRPLYKDLPVYDAIRELGPSEDARKAIGLDQEILVLCSYDDSHFASWKHIRSRLQRALWKSDVQAKSVVRLQDVQNPQLVSLSLYDRIRRCTGCVADWTNSSASTFFELGVRIAASQFGVVQIASTSWIADITRTRKAKRQLDLMLKLFDPIQYDERDEAIGAAIAERLIEIRNQPELQGSYGLRHIAAEALARVNTRVADVVMRLQEEADALYHPEHIRRNIPQALYYEVPEIKRDQERASLERRIAAWLYLDQRVRASELSLDDPRRGDWVRIGQLAAAELFDSPEELDQKLAEEISEKIDD